MLARRARFYDALALLTAVVVISFDQWTKALVVANLNPPGSKPDISLLGKYLVIAYIQNNGAAFSLFKNQNNFLAVFILLAIGVIAYLYARMINSGPLFYKIVFGLIVGGAIGNLIDRARHSGYVVDFISFRIPEINYYFAIFNIADACISVGVFLLFVLVAFGGLHHSAKSDETSQNTSSSVTNSGTLQAKEQDAQS
ncbi:lipoprotein signal peptidase [Reticulibacter mediterranei]|uniref:Lipoprotein signal peptidase n=1 Tax=Reticulibacter mediterranei TaxID=2778369 RepID=A0A8J3IHM1_9CHLR|nr:signal peptidase II [Reticulibacter mediterranei]GHO90915.1 lipoprotein signal peptidase [Reticulibacter mediterranei]